MEQNPLTFERYAEKLQTAMKVEKLMNKDVADIFDVPASYMSILNRDPKSVPTPFMEKIRAWDVSGKLLREYKLPKDQEFIDALQDSAEKAMQNMAEAHEAAELAAVQALANAPETPPLTKEEKKAKKAARIRELYERSKPPKKAPKPEEGKPADPAGQPAPEGQPGQPDTIIIPRGGDKVDLSKINLRTGTTIFTAEVTDNEIIIRFPLVRQEAKK